MSPIDPSECTHPPAQSRIKERELQGLKVRVEVCAQCGRELLHPADAQRLLNQRAGPSSPVLDAADVVLALLGAVPTRPIITRVSMMKEAFLLEKETAPAAGVNTTGLGFVPYKYGPYSPSIDVALERLTHDGLITITKEPTGRKETFHLTDHGKEKAERVVRRLGTRQGALLKRKRQAWDQMGPSGLLRKVYEEYPSYKAKSRIAGRVKPKRRWT